MELVAFTFAFVAALVGAGGPAAVVLLLAMPTAGFMVARGWRFADARGLGRA